MELVVAGAEPISGPEIVNRGLLIRKIEGFIGYRWWGGGAYFWARKCFI